MLVGNGQILATVFCDSVILPNQRIKLSLLLVVGLQISQLSLIPQQHTNFDVLVGMGEHTLTRAAAMVIPQKHTNVCFDDWQVSQVQCTTLF